jgi:hypothetical protein
VSLLSTQQFLLLYDMLKCYMICVDGYLMPALNITFPVYETVMNC